MGELPSKSHNEFEPREDDISGVERGLDLFETENLPLMLGANQMRIFSILFLALCHINAQAAGLRCRFTEKFESFDGHRYNSEQLSKMQPSVQIVEKGGVTTVSRCSIAPSKSKVTCDDYPVDKIEVDTAMGIKKFYSFRSQFDVQLWPDGKVLENNGRGGLATGRCLPI